MTKLNWETTKTVALIITVFFLLDYLGHYYLEEHNQLDKVPDYYYVHKILYGLPILYIGLFSVSFFQLDIFKKSLALAAIVVLSLQFQYLKLYSSKFNLYVLILHIIILFPLTYFAYKKSWID